MSSDTLRFISYYKIVLKLIMFLHPNGHNGYGATSMNETL